MRHRMLPMLALHLRARCGLPADHPAEFGGFTLPTAFWVRRAMHDLAIHRADAAFALDTDYTIDPQLAVDAIDELLENVASPRPDHGPTLDGCMAQRRTCTCTPPTPILTWRPNGSSSRVPTA